MFAEFDTKVTRILVTSLVQKILLYPLISAIENGKLPIQGEHTIPLCRSLLVIAAAPVRELNMLETTIHCYCHKSFQNGCCGWWALLLKPLQVSPATTGTNYAADYLKTKLCNSTEKFYRSVKFVKKQTFLYFICLFDEKHSIHWSNISNRLNAWSVKSEYANKYLL